MRDLFVKIGTALAKVEEEKGAFEIKCLVSRDPIDPLWDLILSAHWFHSSRKQILDFLTDRIVGQLDYENLIHFSGMVIYFPDSRNSLTDALRKIQQNHREHRYNFMRTEGMVMVPTQLEQARLVIPFDDGLLPVNQEPIRTSVTSS